MNELPTFMCNAEVSGFLVGGEERWEWRYVPQARDVVDGVVGVEFEETGSRGGSGVEPNQCADGGGKAGECWGSGRILGCSLDRVGVDV